MSKRRKLFVNIILITIMVLLVLVSTLLYINFYPRVSLHLISDDTLYDTLQIKKNSSVPTLKKPEKEGYVFVGWYTDQDCTEPFQYNEAVSNDMELYAKYEAIDYSLTFNCYYNKTLYTDIYSSRVLHVDDHVWTPDGTEEVIINGETVTLKDLREGYTFIGWATTQSATSVLCGPGDDFLMPATDVRLYAVWEPNAYAVTFLIQDLSNNAKVDVDERGFVAYNAENQKVYTSEAYKYEAKMNAPTTPIHDKKYYSFYGWYLDPEFTQYINFDQARMGLNQIAYYDLRPMYDVDNTAPIVLYGRWKVEEFDVLFCLNKDARTGSTYSIVDQSIMVGDTQGGILNSDYFKAKSGYYYNVKMRAIDGGIYSSDLLDGRVHYTSDSSIVSHKFLGWYTEKNGGTLYNNEKAFDPEDFEKYYTSADAGFEFLRPNVKTYILYANWDEFYHIKYVYQNKTYDTQPVGANTSGKIRDLMSGIKNDGYYFDGWSRTQSNSDTTVYKTDTTYRFIVDASMMSDDTLYFGTTRKITLYPHWSPNEYHIKYDFSINTLSDDKIICIESNPQNIEYSDYLTQKLMENPDPVVSYKSEVESHTIYSAIDESGVSNAKYTKGDSVYLLCGWAIVDDEGNVLETYDGLTTLTAKSLNYPICKYSKKRNNKADDGSYDFVIKAIWKTQMTVRFDKGYDDVEGELPEDILTITGSTITIPSNPTPTRPYHIFKGWVTAENRTTADGSENYDPTTRYVGRNKVTFGEDTILYASWVPIVYTLNIYNTNTDGSRGSLIKQIKMTYADYAGNVGEVVLGSTITFGNNSTDIYIPSGYTMDGFELSNGEVMFEVGKHLTVNATYQVDGGEGQITKNVFDPSKSSSVAIFAKYSIKEYAVTVSVVDPDGNPYDDKSSIVVENVVYGTVVGGNGGFVMSNGLLSKIELSDGVAYDYWTISGVDGRILDITTCYQVIDRDITITLYTKVQTYGVTLLVVDPLNNAVNTRREYIDVKYNTPFTDIQGIDYSIPDVFGFESGTWYQNDIEVNIDEIIVKSNIALITKYVARQVGVIYYKSLDDTVKHNATVEYNTSFTLPEQNSLSSDFAVENKQLATWKLADGTELGFVGLSLNMSLYDLMARLNKSESETKGLFEQNEGVLSLKLYAGYAKLYSVKFADSDETFDYKGQYSKTLSYVENRQIDLVEIIREYISDIDTKTGYEYKQKWQITGTDTTIDISDESYMYTITGDILLSPIVEKQTYTTKYLVVYNDGSEAVLEGFDNEVQLGDAITLPNLNDVQSILSHGGVSYRALKWYLKNNDYQLGDSITITSDLLSDDPILSFRLDILQLRTFTYISGKAGIPNQSITAVTGDEIEVGYIGETQVSDFKNNEIYTEYISAWKIDDTNYEYGAKYVITDATPSVFRAVWSVKTVNVIYHQNASDDDDTTFTVINNFNSTFQVVNQNTAGFSKNMYRITGWSTTADGSGNLYTLGESISLRQIDDFHLYAVWTRVYTVKYSDTESGKTYTADDLLYDGEEYLLLSSEALSSMFTKEGHYIAMWEYASVKYAPETKVTADDLGNPESESITFTVVWGADSLTVTIKYTDTSNNIYGNPKEITTTWGATLEKTNDIKFDTTRSSLLDSNNIEYRFSCFEDQDGKKYYVGEDGYIEIGVVTKNLVLTTSYVKVLKLTYDLSSFGKSNVVIEYAEGDIIGSDTNALLTSADDRIGDIEGKVLVGWNDGTQNYRIALNPSDSGYNYVESWIKYFEIKANVTLTPVELEQYTLTIWKDLTSNGEFDTTTKEEISLVEGDIVARDFDEDVYKGFVRQTAGYEYDPNARCTYGNNISFTLTSDLVSAYQSTKSINLYPVKYVSITFIISELNYSQAFKYVAGEPVSQLPEQVSQNVVDNDIVYFDSWINAKDNSAVQFGTGATENKYYEDTTIKAVYRNFYSIQYKGMINSTETHNIIKIKLNESNNLLDETTANSIYSTTGKTLVGFNVCYTENGTTGAHCVDNNGQSVVFGFGEAIVASDSKFDDWKNLLIFPVYKPALVNISFSLGDADASVFSVQNAGNYVVETGAEYTIDKTETSISITFKSIIDQDTREGNMVTVTVTVDKSKQNCTLSAFKFDSNYITVSGKFDYSQDTINITFEYTTNSVNLNVLVKYNNAIQTNSNYGYFKNSDNTSHYNENFTGDGKVSVTLTACEVIATTHIARFVGWFDGDTQIISGGVFAISGENGEVLTITNMTESTTIYAKFVAGYVNITQKLDAYDYRNDNEVSTDFVLRATFENIVTVDSIEYTGGQVTFNNAKTLSADPTSIITITYEWSSIENWTLWGVQIGENKIQLDSNNSITFQIDTENIDIVLLVVPVNVTVTFTGYNNANLGTGYTKTFAYNTTIDLNNIDIPSEVLSNNEPEYTFVSWNYDNTPLTADTTTITSTWEKLYKVQIVDTKDSSKNGNIYVIYRQSITNTPSANGNYKNFFNLNSTDVSNFQLEKYIVEYKYNNESQTVKEISASETKIYYYDFILKYLDNNIVNNDYANVSDVVITTVYSRLFSIIDETSSTTLKQNLKNNSKFELDDDAKEGHTFIGWEFSYVNSESKTIKSETITFSEEKSLSDIFGSTFNDDSCPSSVIKANAVFEINTYTLEFKIPDSMSSYGEFVTATTSYTLNWNTEITFNTTNGTATFTNSDGNSVQFEVSAKGGNKFVGFYDSEKSVSALDKIDFKSNTTIYCKFVTSQVTVSANLNYYVANKETGTIGGYIVVDGNSTSNLFESDSYYTNDEFVFAITSATGFSLTSVAYEMAEANQTLTPNSEGKYSIVLTGDCVITIRFDAINTNASISIKNNTDLTETPFITISSPINKVVEDITSQNFASGPYTSSAQLVFKPNIPYYSISKISYKIDNIEGEFTLDSARSSNKYTYYVDDSGNYVVNYEYASKDIEIIVELDLGKIWVTMYNLNGSVYKIIESNYKNWVRDANDSLGTDYNAIYLFDNDGKETTDDSNAVGGYRFTYCFTSVGTDNNGIPTADHLAYYPQTLKYYKLILKINSADNDKVSSNSSHVWSNGDISLADLDKEITLNVGYQITGYNIYLGKDNTCKTVDKQVKSSEEYIYVSSINTQFADSTEVSDFIIYFEPIIDVVQYNVGFAYVENNGASGSMTIVDAENNTVSSDSIMLSHFDYVVRSGNVLKIYSSTGALKYTVSYAPANACKLSKITYGSSVVEDNGTVSINGDNSFIATFENGDAEVRLKFNIDKNINNLNAVELTIGDNKWTLKETTEITVSGTNNQSFNYSITLSNGYTCDDSLSGTITFSSDNNGKIVKTFHIVVPSSQINVVKSIADGMVDDQCEAVLHYYEPVKDGGVITGYASKEVKLSMTTKSFDIYLGDAPYITTKCHSAYKVKGVYDSASNGNIVATYDNTNEKYVLNISKSNFYVIFEEKTISLQFKIGTVVFENIEFKSTDIDGFCEKLGELNTKDDMDLNEYLVSTKVKKADYKYIMLVKNTYNINNNEISSYWNLGSVINISDGITYLQSNQIFANTTTAHLVTISVLESNQGYFTTADKNKDIDYVLYSSTSAEVGYTEAQYKVVSGKNISDLPTVTPCSSNSSIYAFDKYEIGTEDKTNWSDIGLTIISDTTITLRFKIVSYNIKVTVTGLSDENLTSIQSKIITTNLSATDTFSDVLDAVFTELSNSGLSITDWVQNGHAIKLFKNCVDKQYWYESSDASLKIDGTTLGKEEQIWKHEDQLENLTFVFSKNEKQGLSIKVNEAFTNAYNLKTNSGNYCLSFNNFTTYENNSGTTMYVVSGTTVDLNKLGLLDISNNVVLLSDICKYKSFTYGGSGYTFSHFSASNSNYMTVFSESEENGRILNDASGTATNSDITISSDITLSVNIIQIYEIRLTLTTRNTANDAILTDRHINNWNYTNSQSILTEEVWAGKKIYASDYASFVYNKVADSKGLIQELNAGDIYIMVGAQGSSTDNNINSYVVNNDVVLYGYVEVCYKTINIYNESKYQGGNNYASIPYSVTVLAGDGKNIFINNSGLPFIVVDNDWVLNSAITNKTEWTIDENHTFVGYLCKLNNKTIVIGINAGNYVDANGDSYEVMAYTSLTDDELNEITEFHVVYWAGVRGSVSRNITTYLQGANSDVWTAVQDDNKYTNGYNKYGYDIKITYTDIYGAKHENESMSDGGITTEKIRLGSTVTVTAILANWYDVSSGNYKTVSNGTYNGTYTFEFSSYSGSNLVLNINAYYYDLSLPSAIKDWTVTSNDQKLFDDVTSSTWTFPKGASYTITNNAPTKNRFGGASTTFTMTVTDHNGNKSVNTITATYNNENNIAVVQDGISGTVFTTFQDVQGGIKSTEGTINSVASGTVINLYSYTPIVVDARVSVQGSDIKTYTDYIMYYYNSDDNTAVLYHDKVLYIGLTDGEEGYFSKIGDKYVDEFVKAFIEKIYGDSEVNALITGKNGTLTLNIRTMSVTSSSASPQDFLLSTDSTNSTDLTINYAYNSSSYTFTINKDSSVPTNIGFLESDIDTGKIDSVGEFDYVSSVSVNKNSIVIEGERYEGGAVKFKAESGYIKIEFYDTASVSGEPKHTTKVYYDPSSPVDFSAIATTLNGDASSVATSVDISTCSYTLVMTQPDTSIKYTSSDYRLKIVYRIEFSSDNLKSIISEATTSLFNSKSNDIDYYISPLNVTSYEKVEGVDYINLKTFANNVNNSVKKTAFERCVDVSYGKAFETTEEYGNPLRSTSKSWSRFLGITDNDLNGESIYTLNYDSKTESLVYNDNISNNMDLIWLNDITHYLSFEIYNSIYSYDLNVEGADDIYLSEDYTTSGSITWGGEYAIEISNYKTELENVVVRTFGGEPTTLCINDADLKLVGKYASYEVVDTSFDTVNCKIKLCWKQCEYTVALYGKEGSEGSESDFLADQSSYHYYRLKSGQTIDVSSWQSELAENYIMLPDRYIRDKYEIAYVTTSNPAVSSQLSYRSYLGTTENVKNGLMFLYLLYNPQSPYTDGLFTINENIITGWNYDTASSSAYYKFFNSGHNHKLLIIPEWNFASSTAYKITEIEFNDDYSSYYSVFANQSIYSPADIKYVYISKNITSIIGLDDSTSAVDEDGFYGSHDGIVNSTTASSITRLTWAMYGENNLKGYIVDSDNSNFCALGATDSNNQTVGYLMDKEKTKLYHVPSQLFGNSDVTINNIEDMQNASTIDPFAFAYVNNTSSSDLSTLTLDNAKYIGSCAWYGAENNFATTIKFDALDYIGYQIVDARNCKMNIWFYDNIPFIDHDYTGIYSNGSSYCSSLNVGILASYESSWSSGKFRIYYQADYDGLYNNYIKGMRGKFSLGYLFCYSGSENGTSDDITSFANGRMVFEMIEADVSAFVVSNGIIQGIRNDKLSLLRNVILLPSTSVTGVSYLGQVNSNGKKLESVASTREGVKYIIIPRSYNYVGSILNVLEVSGSTNTYYNPGIKIENICLKPSTSTANWTSIGDGTYSAFGDMGRFGVWNIELSNVSTIKGASYWTGNNTIGHIELAFTETYDSLFSYVEIGDYGLAGLTSLQELQASVSSLGKYALKNCTNLMELFYGWDTNEYGLSSIAEGMGDGSGLCTISLIEVGTYNFDYSTIYKVFLGMNNLQEVLVNNLSTSNYTNNGLWTRDGILYGYGSGSYDSYLLHVPRALNIDSVAMRTESYNDWGADKIAPYALSDNISTDLTIEIYAGDLESIGDYAFNGSKIENLTFKSYVKGINSENAFTGATELKNITIINGANGVQNYKTIDGCVYYYTTSSKYLYYVPENWGADKTDGGETFTFTDTATFKSIGNNRAYDQRAFGDNRNIKYIVIEDSSGVFNETNINYHVATMKKIKSVTINDIVVYVASLGTEISSIYLDGSQIWTDGTNTYYSSGVTQQYLNNSKQWVDMTWSGLTSFNGIDVWTDGSSVYYSVGKKQYTWTEKKWSGSEIQEINISGRYIWSDGSSMYYSNGSTQYILIGDSWSEITWTGLALFKGDDVWTDGEKIYFSSGEIQKYLDDSNQWVDMTWSGLTSFDGSNIWTDGENLYYSASDNQYVYDTTFNKWRHIYRTPDQLKFNGKSVWTDGTYVYYSNGTTTYELCNARQSSSSELYTWISRPNNLNMSYSVGYNVWTDGVNIYYSQGTEDHYVFDNITKTWTTKTWSGLTNFHGADIWTDGTNYYYSSSSKQYVLNGSTWETMTWSGLTPFSGNYIWTDGTNIYYSYYDTQYVLNKSTSTWSTKTWSGSYYPSDGRDVWTDGTNYYYSSGSTQYVLNGSTWTTKTWSGLTSFNGMNIWTDGTYTYCYNYVLNGSTWEEKKTWTGLRSVNGRDVWTDGNSIYYSPQGSTYELCYRSLTSSLISLKYCSTLRQLLFGKYFYYNK